MLTLADIRKQKDEEKKVLGLFNSIIEAIQSLPKAEYTELLEQIKSKDIDLTPIIDEIRKLKLSVKVDPPKVNIPAPVVKVPAPVVNVPEQKPDEKIHKLLDEIKKVKRDVLVDKKQYRTLITSLEAVKEAVEKININISAGGGTDNTLLKQIAENTDELELKADQINLNTDEIEAKLDTLNQDKATASKQDEIIQAINNQSGETVFKTNDIIEYGSDTFFGKESKDGDWWFMKIDANSNFSHATKANNSTVNDYQSAKASYNTLSYGDYSNAF